MAKGTARRPAHRPVLLEKSLELLAPSPGAVVADCTLGGGGHAAAILAHTAPDGILVGLDADAQAVAATRERLASFGARAVLVQASFRRLAEVLADVGQPALDGVLLDLGISSVQLDSPERGFRFGADTAGETPLDMRMDPDAGHSAADLLAVSSADELAGWFRRYGELPGAGRLARAIVEARRERPLRTARDLVALVERTAVGGRRRHHPATLVFQALRVAVNDELAALAEGLDAAIAALRPGGRGVVISYHSLEDRIVKHRFRDEARGCVCPPEVPVCVCGRTPRLRVLTRRPLRPDDDEIRANPRARSARLRAAERLADAP